MFTSFLFSYILLHIMFAGKIIIRMCSHITKLCLYQKKKLHKKIERKRQRDNLVMNKKCYSAFTKSVTLKSSFFAPSSEVTQTSKGTILDRNRLQVKKYLLHIITLSHLGIQQMKQKFWLVTPLCRTVNS